MEWGAWWGTALLVAIVGFIIQGISKHTLGLAIGFYVFAGILFLCPIIGTYLRGSLTQLSRAELVGVGLTSRKGNSLRLPAVHGAGARLSLDANSWRQDRWWSLQ
jgi:hypothetical protein